MSTLREMAEEVAKRLDSGGNDFFLVVQGRVTDPDSGVRQRVVVTNVDMTVVDARARAKECANGHN